MPPHFPVSRRPRPPEARALTECAVRAQARAFCEKIGARHEGEVVSPVGSDPGRTLLVPRLPVPG